MIHDIILSLISRTESQVIKDLLYLNTSSQFIHPAEAKTLKDITKIVRQYREIKNFTLKYSTYANDGHHQQPFENEKKLLPPGLYLQCFANSLDEVLACYDSAIVELEKKFLRKPTISLMFIFHEIEKFRPLLEFMLRLLNSVETQKLFGCQILEFLQENSLHGNPDIMDAIQKIQKSVYTIYIQQLCQWIMYGKFMDPYGEFFIQHIENIPTDSSDKRPSYSTQTSLNTFQSSEPSVHLDLWQYEIKYKMLPRYFPKTWAERVLFIGQTVLMFNSDPRESIKSKSWNSDGGMLAFEGREDQKEKQSVWGEQEQEFYRKFHRLQEMDKLTVLTFEQIVDEIKICVTEHLSEIAIKEADLVKQLKLIKDFFLLGRGELFYEFIKGLLPLYTNVITEGTIRDINRAFQAAASSVNIHDEMDLFTFNMPKEDIDSFSYETKGFFNFLTLTYKIKWPLHLMFPPTVLDRYNDLFRFLMRIKKIQYDLHMVWCYHREGKATRNNTLLQFRNKLMFLIDNLQYYLQVDVLESQFSIMMNKISGTKDFEQIQRAHNCFQANILGLCFLLENTNQMTNCATLSFNENPVLTILNKIIVIVDQFTTFSYICSNPMNEGDQQTFNSFEKVFASLVDSLLKMLSGLQASAPLAQLLLRLDFNHWFSSQKLS